MMKDRSAIDAQRKLFYILIVIAISLFVVSYTLSLNEPPQEVSHYSFNGGSLNVTPSILYVHNFLWYSPSATVSVTLNNNTSAVQIVVFQEYSTHLAIFNETFHNVSFFSFNFGLYPTGSPQIDKFAISINGQVMNVSVPVENSSYPLIGELSLLFSFGLFMIGLYFAGFKSKLWVFPITFTYLVLAAFLGQRYDMFFMISGGLHILSGVNPFIQSVNLPGTLKWSYPPYYLIWSTISDWFSGAITHTPIPTPSSLIFPDVRIGNYYDAWLGFVPGSLPVYYLLAKLPMVLSVIGVYYLLFRKFNLPYNLTKLWLLSPFVILIGVVWGQLDIIASFFLVLSIYFMKKERSGMAILASVLGFWVKIFPIFILPFIVIESKHKLRDLGIALVSSIPALLIYSFSGNFIRELEVMIYSRSVPTFNGIFNAQGLSWQVIVSKLGATSFPPLFLYLFLPFLIVLCVVYYYKRGNVVNYVIMEFLFFFLTYNYVDPQYLIVLVPLFLINRDLWNYMVFSLYPFLFTLLTYSFAYFVVPAFSLNYFSSPLGQQEALRTWITSSNIFVFPLVGAFAFSVIVTMFMIIKNRQFHFLKDTIFSR
ncbi:MAG: hypothetical protein M0Z77_07195 [Thermoplasmatales archaeon]|nr:hypothetical protein [Thermoplasmatales archaeon]